MSINNIFDKISDKLFKPKWLTCPICGDNLNSYILGMCFCNSEKHPNIKYVSDYKYDDIQNLYEHIYMQPFCFLKDHKSNDFEISMDGLPRIQLGKIPWFKINKDNFKIILKKHELLKLLS